MRNLTRSLALLPKHLFFFFIILAVLGVTLATAPFLAGGLAVAKQWWLMFFVGVAVLLWLWQVVITGRFSFKKDMASLILGLGLIVLAVSTLLALSPAQALLGDGSSAHNLVNFLALAAAYFLISNSGYRRGDSIFYWGLVGLGGLAAVWGLISVLTPLWGAPAGSIPLPANSVYYLLGWLGLPLLLVFANSVFGFFRQTIIGKIISTFSAGIILVLALIVNSSSFWLALLIGVLGILVLAIFREEARPLAILGIGMAAFFLAIMTWAGGAISIGGSYVDIPGQVLPSQGSSWNVARQALEGSPFVGSGPGSFDEAYLRYRSPSLNQTPFWPLSFNAGFSGFLTWLTEFGYLGAGLLAGFLALVLLQGWLGSRQTWPWLLGALYLSVLWFRAPFSLEHYALLFTMAALVVKYVPGRSVELRGLSSQIVNAFYAGAFIVVVGVVLGILAVSAKGVSGYFIDKGRNNADLSLKLVSFQQAAKLNPASDLSWRLISEVRRRQLVELMNQAGGDKASEAQNKLTSLSNQAVQAAQKAIRINSSQAAWQQLGLVYETLMSISTDAGPLALDAYTEAQKRHPASPALAVDRARVALQLSRQLKSQLQILQQSPEDTPQKQERLQSLQDSLAQLLNQALDLVAQSLQLKPDYAPAHFLLVQVRDERGELDQAIAQARRIVQAQPAAAGTWFQLGFLQFKKGNYNQAAESFEKAIKINSDLDNARYLLGLAYNNLDQPKRALEQFRILKQKNPDNQEIAKIVENLESGRFILEGIVPPAQAPQERAEPPVETTQTQTDQTGRIDN